MFETIRYQWNVHGLVKTQKKIQKSNQTDIEKTIHLCGKAGNYASRALELSEKAKNGNPLYINQSMEIVEKIYKNANQIQTCFGIIDDAKNSLENVIASYKQIENAPEKIIEPITE